jgi:DNA-directed RNA polymerase specialized sigma24 family protein
LWWSERLCAIRSSAVPPSAPETLLHRARQEAHLVALHHAGQHTSAELAELFGVARSTVYRAVERHQNATHA